MWHVIAYLVLLLVSCAAGLILGGAPERIGALIMIGGTGLSWVSVSVANRGFLGPEVALFAVDAAVLLALGGLAMAANRFWPMPMTAFMIPQVMGHVLRLADPTLLPWLYWLTSSLWGYPMLLCLLTGVIGHRLRARHSADKPWSSFSSRSARMKRASAPRG